MLTFTVKPEVFSHCKSEILFQCYEHSLADVLNISNIQIFLSSTTDIWVYCVPSTVVVGENLQDHTTPCFLMLENHIMDLKQMKRKQINNT